MNKLTFLSPSRKPLVFRDQLSTKGNVTTLPAGPRTGPMLFDSSNVNASLVPFPVKPGEGPRNVVMSGRVVLLDGISPSLALPGNPNRKRLIVMNLDAAQTVFFEYGQQANSDSFQLGALGNIDEDQNCPTGDVWLFSTKVGHKIKVSEGT